MKNKLFIYILTIPIILSGCINKIDGGKEFKKKDRAPNSLIKVSSGIANVLKDTEDIEKLIDKTYIEEMDEDKEEDEKQNKESQNSSKEQDSSEGEENASKQEESSKQQGIQNNDTEKGLEEEQKGNKEVKIQIEREIKLEEKWKDIHKQIEKIHENWNSYEVEGTKKGMTDQNSDGFRNSLNKLTKSIESKNLMEVYDFASQALESLDSLFGMYKDEIIGDVNKLKYYTYRAYLFSLKGEIVKATETLRDLEEIINAIRTKLGEDKKQLDALEKTNISIIDMRKALKENSIKLNRIKKDIIIKNLEELGDK